jgi:hypothetical protein
MCLPAFLLDLSSRISLFLPGFPRSFSDLSESPMDLSVSTLHAPSPCISFLCLLWISYPKSLCISFVSPMCLPVSPLDLQFRTSLYLPSHHLPISSCVSSDLPVFSINLYVSPLDFPSRISLYLLIPALPVSPIPHLPMSTWVFPYLPWVSRIYPRLLIPNLPVFFMHLSVSFLHSSSQISLSLH